MSHSLQPLNITSAIFSYPSFNVVEKLNSARLLLKRIVSLFVAILFAASFSFAQTTLFEENFESYSTTESLNTSGTNQWLQYNITAGAGSSSWSIGGTGTYCISGSRSLTMYYGSYYTYRNNSNCERVAYYSQKIDASSYTDLKLSFKWLCSGESDWRGNINDYGTVVWSTNGTTWTNVTTTQYQGYTSAQTVTDLDLSDANGTQFYIGFRWYNNNSTANNPPFTIDDISVTGTELTSAASEGFEGTTEGWTLDGSHFTIGTPGTSNGCTSAYSGSYILGTILNGNYGNSWTEANSYAISPAYDCSALTGVTLSFQRWASFANNDYGYLYVSNDNGVTWFKYTNQTVTNTNYGAWTSQSIDISSYADGNSQVRVKFTMTSNNNQNATGWNIDDVSISGVLSYIDYYSVGSGNANELTSWENASGANPASFTADNQRFIIQNAHSMTTSGSWSVSGNTTALYIQDGSLTAGNDITLSANTTFQIDDEGTFNHNINSNNVWGGNELFSDNSTVNYNYAGNQTVAGVTYGNLSLSNSGSKTLTGAVTVNGDLSIAGSAVLVTNQYQVTGNSAGTLTMAAGTGLSLGSASASTNVLFPSGYATANITLDNSSTVTYQTAGAQSVAGISYGNLTIAGGNTKTMQGSVTVNGILSFSSGNLSLGSGSNNLTLANGATITGSFDSSHMIVCDGTGSLIKEGDDSSDFAIIYPVGTGSYYTPMTITSGVSGTGSLSVRSVASVAPGEPAANETDLNRYWLITTSGVTVNSASVSFEYNNSDVGTGGTEANYKPAFYSGAWSTPSGSVDASSDIITVTGASSLAGQWSAREPEVTYYSYQSGNWNAATTWTTDPSGTLSINSGVPDAEDRVVILNGRTVSLSSNSNSCLSLDIKEGGILDIASYTGNSFGTVSGQGKMRLSSTTFPTGTFDSFVAANGGTVEYYNSAGFTFQQKTYNNLIINLNTSALIATLDDAMTVNGDFTVTQGVFCFGKTTTVGITATILGDIYVSANAKITYNSGNAQNYLYVGGDFTIDGTVDFWENTTTDYYGYNYNNNAKTDVVFNNTTKDQSLLCNGSSEFYRIAIDKGTDKTFILNIDASNTSNFKLYGRNSLDQTGTSPDLSNPNALGLLAGTLRLGENIVIPSLSSKIIINQYTSTGGTYSIDEDAMLWLDGANLTFSNVADTDDGTTLILYGAFQITGNSVFTDNSKQGIIMRTTASFIMEDGTVTTECVRTSYQEGTHRGSFNMSGGTLTVRGSNLPDLDGMEVYSAFTLPYTDNVLNISGGTINILSPNPITGGAGSYFSVLIGADPQNISITGGTMNITIPNSSNAYINSTAPFWDLNITGTNTNRSAQIRAYAGNSTIEAMDANDLVVLNDFNLQNYAVFDVTTPDPDANVSVAGDFTIESSATYTPGNNTTTFNGDGTQTITPTGTITNNLYNLTLDNKSDLSLAAKNITTRGVLNISKGCTLRDNGYVLYAQGNIENSGTHFKPATGAGRIELSGTAAQTISGDGNGVFNNITLNKTGGSVTSAANMSITGNLRLVGTSGDPSCLNIGSYNLALSSDAYIYSDASTGTDFSNNRMIVTNGLASDKGVSKTYNSTEAFLIPFGFSTYYLPASIQYSSSPTTYGTVTSRPVNERHPLAQGSDNALNCYWKTESSGFEGIQANSVKHLYYYNDSFWPVSTIEASAAPGMYYPYSWTYINNASLVVDGSNEISYNNASQADGDFTAGLPAAFGAIPKLYSSATPGDWDDVASWSAEAVGGTSGSVLPSSSTIVIIGDETHNHTITIPSGTVGQSCGSLYIAPGSTLDITNTTGHDFASLPEEKVSGAGTLRIGSGTFPGGDFGAFIGKDGGTVEYYTYAGNIIIPVTSSSSLSLTNYNNLKLTTTGTYTVTMPDTDLTVYGDLTTNGSGTGTSRLNTTTAGYTVTVEGDVNVETGIFEFRNRAQTLVVNGDFVVANGATFQVQNNAAATHTLEIGGNLEIDGAFDVNKGTGIANTYFVGTVNDTIKGSGSTIDFYTLIVDKGSDQTSVLTLASDNNITTGFTNPFLTLNNGTFRVDNTPLNITVSTTSSFSIPSTACFSVKQGAATIGTTSDDGDVALSGKIEVLGGTLNIGNPGTTAYNNDIEYASAGSPTIEIVSGGILNVNGQIRRSTTVTSGALIYNQTGGNVVIYGNDSEDTRAMLEITNSGSQFNMSDGTLTLRKAGGTTFSDLYIRPETYDVSGGTIYLGDASSTAGQNFNVVAKCPLWNIVAGNASSSQIVTLNTLPLTLNDLTINASSVFNANGLDVIIGGSLVNNNGSASSGLSVGGYQAGSETQTTTFSSSSAQRITGSGANLTNFANLILSCTNTIFLDNNIRVAGDIALNSGILNDGGNTISLIGDVSNYATHYSSAISGGFIFCGTATQNITGNGSGVFGNVTVNNANGVNLKDNSIINKELTFTNGSLYIDDYQLTFAADATIGGTPGASKMIILNGVVSDLGVKKIFSSGDSDAFTFPIGISGKYTPVTYNFSDNNATDAYIVVKPVNYLHKSISTTPDNYIDYYWDVASSGFDSYTINHIYNYVQEDVTATTIEESDFVVNRFFDGSWYNLTENSGPGSIDASANTITVSSVGYIDGEYCAGDEFTNLPKYYSRNATLGGNWNNVNSWTTVADGSGAAVSVVPNGNPVEILEGHTITTTANSENAYSVTIGGTLNIGQTLFHNFGHVSGGGKLKMAASNEHMFVFPGGEFDDFLDNPTSIIEYASSDYANLPVKPGNNYKPLQNVILSGGGVKYISADNLKILGDLTIESGAKLNNTLYSKDITISGDWIDENSSANGFLSGSGNVLFEGTSTQNIKVGYTEKFYNLTIDNSAGVDITTGSAGVEVSKYLYLTNGNFTTQTNKLITITNTSVSAVVGGSSSSFVNGPLSKSIISGHSFSFPVGGSTRYGQVVLLNTTVSSSPQTWTATYFNANPTDGGYLTAETNLYSPISGVSNNEYWIVTRPTGGSANIRLRWDEDSYLAFTQTSSLRSRLRVVEYDIDGALWTERGSSVSGTETAGTVSTTTAVTDDDYIFTLGHIGISATIDTDEDLSVCDNEDKIYIPVSLSGTAPWTLNYQTSDGTTTKSFTQTGITSSSYEISISGTEIGGYSETPYTLTLTSVSDASLTAGVCGTNSVDITVKQTYIPVIEGSSVAGTSETRVYSVESHVGSTYAWSWVGSTGGTIGSATGNSTNIIFSSTAGTYTLQVIETTSTGCSATETLTITVSTMPTPSISPVSTSVCAGDVITYTTEAVGSHTYQWVVTGGTPATGTGNSIIVTWGTTAGDASIKVTETNGSVSGSDELALIISTPPSLQSYTVTSPCVGSNGVITLNSSEENISYELFLSDGSDVINSVSGTGGVINVTTDAFDSASSKSYYIYASNEGCNVRIPSVETDYIDMTAAYGQEITFTTPDFYRGVTVDVPVTSGSFDAYSIDYETSGFVDVTDSDLDDIQIVIPATATPNSLLEATLTVKSTTTGCISPEYPISGTINPDYVWKGTESTEWEIANNWNFYEVPTSSYGVLISGSFASVMPVFSGSEILSDISVQNEATLTVKGNARLTVDNLAIGSNSEFILESTGVDGLASFINNGTISGEGVARVKLTLPAAGRWYYLSSSVKGATLGNFNTGADGTGVYVYRNQWYSTNSSHANVALLNLEGVSTQYTGDYYSLNYTGVLNSGLISRSYANRGWFLFGNPYPCYINWQDNSGWSRENTAGTMWYRTLINGEMTFVTYNRWAVEGARAALYPSGDWGEEEDLALIPPMQSVWIKAYAATSVSIDNSSRSHGLTSSYLKSAEVKSSSDIIRIVSSKNEKRDGTVIYFNENSTEALDNGDSEKRFNESTVVPEIYTQIDNSAVAINGFAALDETGRDIPLCVRNQVEGEVTLKFDLSRFYSLYSVELEDKETGAMVNLNNSNSYTYTPKVLGYVTDRFVIHISYNPTSVIVPDDDTETTVVDISITGLKGKAIVDINSNLLVSGDALIEVYTLDGQKVSELTTASVKTNVTLPSNDIMYVVKVTAGGKMKTAKVLGKN